MNVATCMKIIKTSAEEYSEKKMCSFRVFNVQLDENNTSDTHVNTCYNTCINCATLCDVPGNTLATDK